MVPIGAVRRYLDAMSFRLKQAEERAQWNAFPFVTISRRAGAGGRSLAAALEGEMRSRSRDDPALFLDWHVFDETLLRLLTEHPGSKTRFEELLAEEYRSKAQDYVHQLLTGGPPQDLVLARVFHSLRAVAGFGKALIIGRSGACLTRDLHKGVHVRLVGSEKPCVDRLRERYGLDEGEARRRRLQLDASRARLVAAYFERDIDDPLLYDCVWNTDRVSFEEIARAVCDRVEEKARAYSVSQRAASSA